MNITLAAPVPVLDRTVEIQIPTLNEEKEIKRCVKSVARQDIKKVNENRVTVSLIDSNSEDRTVEIAEPYVDRIITAPKGKLTARDFAIKKSKADIIVSFDADCYYPPRTVSALVYPILKSKNTVASGGRSIFPDVVSQTVQNSLENISKALYNCNYLSGRISALKRDAYLRMGGFNLDINQRNAVAMVWEEEITLAGRLIAATGGNVVRVHDAVAFTSNRRLYSMDYIKRILSGERF